ncbi:protein gar2-like [Diprion similis]|uniref:protein gar2-like n=1 Tax=Diprion similis TaxID=362088 RepID=UPI001EF78238|nr:protein gar2-like [Diprion similis]
MKVICTLVFTILFAAVTSAGRIHIKQEDEIRDKPDDVLSSILHKLPHDGEDLLRKIQSHKVKGPLPEIPPHEERDPLLGVGHPPKHHPKELKEHRRPAPHQKPPKHPENEDALVTTTESVPEGTSTNSTTPASITVETESDNEIVTSTETESTTESEDDGSTESSAASTFEPNSDNATEASGDSESTTTPDPEEEEKEEAEGGSTEANVTTTVKTELESESEAGKDSVVSTTESETTEVATTILSTDSESVETTAVNGTKSWWQRMFSWI